jgi:hypothetical protein
MISFRLEKVSANKALVKYHVLNNAGELCGSINVAPLGSSRARLEHTGAKLKIILPALPRCSSKPARRTPFLGRNLMPSFSSK